MEIVLWLACYLAVCMLIGRVIAASHLPPPDPTRVPVQRPSLREAETLRSDHLAPVD